MSKTELASANEKAVENAFNAFARKLHSTLKSNPELHGSMTLSVQMASGVIDRFRITTDETEKCIAG